MNFELCYSIISNNNTSTIIKWSISGGGEREVIETKQYRLTFRKTLGRRKESKSTSSILNASINL